MPRFVWNSLYGEDLFSEIILLSSGSLAYGATFFILNTPIEYILT